MTSMLKPSLRLHTSNANLDLNTSSPSRLPFDPQSIASTAANFVPMHPSSTTTPTLASPTSIRSTHTDTGSINTMDNNHTNTAGAMALHTGAIDKTTITTRPPTEVMTKARDVLDSIGICVQPEGVFRLRCVRPPQSSSGSETTPGGPEPVRLLQSAYYVVL
ncbi:hypothetical protein AN958_04297 [Leucoagaricus sp. SymC.cos]|nr:hypothetical protein AN958_04297 [Leucoagaricus sp. SymC.cos]